MKILIASDSYKGSCSSIEVAEAIEDGIKAVDKKIMVEKLAIADGGEGTLDSLIEASGGIIKTRSVVDPLGREIQASYGLLSKDEAIVEMATASGLGLVSKKELDPFKTTTYGTGQLIQAAIEDGVKKIYVGIGGSATNDGGVGMAQALGVSFKDKQGREIGYGGGELARIRKIDYSNINKKIKNIEIVIISDVENPLCGRNGASYVYGAQKGASLEALEKLDKNLRHLANLISRDLNLDIMEIKGSGAAGGLGAGLIAFCGGRMKSGIETILDIVDIDSYLVDTDLVITGEGMIDGQSIYGKVPVGVAKRAKNYNIPVIAVVGSQGQGAEKTYSHGIDLIVDIVDKPMTLEHARSHVKLLIEKAAYNIIYFWVNMVAKNNQKID